MSTKKTSVTVLVLIYLTLTAAIALLGGFLLMIAVGIMHHEWWSTLPTMGYWTAIKLAFLLGIPVTARSSSK